MRLRRGKNETVTETPLEGLPGLNSLLEEALSEKVSSENPEASSAWLRQAHKYAAKIGLEIDWKTHTEILELANRKYNYDLLEHSMKYTRKYASEGNHDAAQNRLRDAHKYAGRIGMEIDWETHTEILELAYFKSIKKHLGYAEDNANRHDPANMETFIGYAEEPAKQIGIYDTPEYEKRVDGIRSLLRMPRKIMRSIVAA